MASSRIQWFASVDQLHRSAIDLLDCGDDYSGGYRAVLDHPIADDLGRLAIPTLLLVARPDALSRYVADYPALPSHVGVRIVDAFAGIPDAVRAYLRGQATAASSGGGAGPTSGTWRFVATARQLFHLRDSGAGDPLLILHDIGGSARGLRAMLAGMPGGWRIVAPDLPGHGATEDRIARPDMSPAATASALSALMDALELRQADIVALGASAAFALALRDAAPHRVGRIALLNPAIADADEGSRSLLPDLTPDPAGSHLLRAWYFLRDSALYFPWHERSARSALMEAQPPGPLALHHALADLMKTDRPEERLSAALATLDPERVAGAGAALFATGAHPARRALPSLHPLPDEPYLWGAPVLSGMAITAPARRRPPVPR